METPQQEAKVMGGLPKGHFRTDMAIACGEVITEGVFHCKGRIGRLSMDLLL